MVIRRWGSRAAGLTVVFGLFIGGLRLLPAHMPVMSEIDRLFPVTEACPTGCMFGIPPETTRLNDGVQMLQAHEWVGGVYGGWRDEMFHREVTVRWRWSGKQPDYIDATVPGIMLARSYSGDGGHVVIGFTVATRLRLYDLQQTYGPTTDGLALYDSSRNAIDYTISYHDPDALTRTSLLASLACPIHLMTYWNAYASLDYRSGHLLSPYVPPEHLSSLCQGS